MNKVMQELGKTLSDQDVNTVAAQHFDAQQVRLLRHSEVERQNSSGLLIKHCSHSKMSLDCHVLTNGKDS